MKYLRKFTTAAQYSAATIYRPSVSLIEENRDTIFDPLVKIKGLTISGETNVTNMATYTVTYMPADTDPLQKGVTWSIVSGSEYATIDANTGVLTALEGADSSEVVIRATSVVNSSVTAEKTLSVTKVFIPTYVEIAGIKWCTVNVGAKVPTEKGLYFQWGDTQGYTAEQVGSDSGKKAFSWADYKYGNGTSSPGATGMTKYNATDGKTVLDLEDDAVNAAYGGNWRMPTTAELQALGAAVDIVWTANYQSTGVAGMICTDKTDSSKVLFFPGAGYCRDGSVIGVGAGGYDWSSSLFSNSKVTASNLSFGYGHVGWENGNYRCYGCVVRGVLGE